MCGAGKLAELMAQLCQKTRKVPGILSWPESEKEIGPEKEAYASKASKSSPQQRRGKGGHGHWAARAGPRLPRKGAGQAQPPQTPRKPCCQAPRKASRQASGQPWQTASEAAFHSASLVSSRSSFASMPLRSCSLFPFPLVQPAVSRDIPLLFALASYTPPADIFHLSSFLSARH